MELIPCFDNGDDTCSRGRFWVPQPALSGAQVVPSHPCRPRWPLWGRALADTNLCLPGTRMGCRGPPGWYDSGLATPKMAARAASWYHPWQQFILMNRTVLFHNSMYSTYVIDSNKRFLIPWFLWFDLSRLESHDKLYLDLKWCKPKRCDLVLWLLLQLW